MKWILIICWLEVSDGKVGDMQCKHELQQTAEECIEAMNKDNQERNNMAARCRVIKLPEPEDA